MSKKRFYFFLFAIISILSFTAIAQAADGFLYVSSSPSKASIAINGKTAGKTPYTAILSPGTYTIVVSLPSYNSATATVTIAEGEVARVELALTKGATLREKWQAIFSNQGAVAITTDIPQAIIYLDSLKRKEKTPATIRNLSEGEHTLVLLSGEYAITRSFTIKRGGTTTIAESFASLASAAAKPTAEELQKKREALPAKLIIRLQQPPVTPASSTVWGSNDTAVLQFHYKKEGSTETTIKELSFDAPETTVEIEKGSYDITSVGTRYRSTTGWITIIAGSAKQKLAEVSSSFSKTFAPDTEYIYIFSYDEKGNLTHTVEEKPLNTPIQ
ncbi:MAG: PEGA domain-containing protein [Candidatus Ratteibacteria bacterium]|jgi:hypothetical protein